MITFHCQRINCRYHKDNDICNCPSNEITININGKCSEYKKGVWHYICAVVSSMNGNAMLPSIELNTETKIGIYFLTQIYNIIYRYNNYGNWSWISFHDNNKSEALTIDQIISNYKMNIDKYNLFAYYVETSNNDEEIIEKITGKPQVKEETNKRKISDDYGFISPSGDFLEESWGEHESLSYQIIERNRWENEWDISQQTGVDFLVYKKHYVLIHAPNGVDINVTYNGNLTKKQKEFLYDYFMNHGEPLRANLYFNED